MELQSIDEWRHRIAQDESRGIRADVVVYASTNLLQQISEDRSLEQAVNVSMLPGIVGASLAMPDIHQGYGFPIGGVAATDWQTGVVSPGGVGFNINCGVRLIRSSIYVDQARPHIRELVNQVFRDVPCGTGGGGPIKLDHSEIDDVLYRGAQCVVDRGYGEPQDTEFAEERGALAEADPEKVSSRAKDRGRDQLGTIGSGNHFLEIQLRG
jgi:tRNA-splicing ligase RtcB